VQRFLALTVVVGIAELVVLIQVGQQLGALNTIGLLILVAIVGAVILKAQGLATFRRLVRDVEARRVPGEPLADGALLVVAGGLLLVPGFLTDVPGLLLLLPPVRRGVRRALTRRWSRRVVVVRGPGRPGSGYELDA
jgi:UPF0716 protein FxsA